MYFADIQRLEPTYQDISCRVKVELGVTAHQLPVLGECYLLRQIIKRVKKTNRAVVV